MWFGRELLLELIKCCAVIECFTSLSTQRRTSSTGSLFGTRVERSLVLSFFKPSFVNKHVGAWHFRKPLSRNFTVWLANWLTLSPTLSPRKWQYLYADGNKSWSKRLYYCIDSRKCQDLYADATILGKSKLITASPKNKLDLTLKIVGIISPF